MDITHLCMNRGLCTSDCQYRPECKKKRIKLMIPGLVLDYTNHRIYTEEYLNEAILRKVELIDALNKKHPEFADVKNRFTTMSI